MTVSEPTRVASTVMGRRPFSQPARTRPAGAAVRRGGFARQHRLVNGRDSVANHAIDGNPFAGPHANQLARLHKIRRALFFTAGCENHAPFSVPTA